MPVYRYECRNCDFWLNLTMPPAVAEIVPAFYCPNCGHHPMRRAAMPKVKKCCFCQYEGNERTFRNVGIDEYPDDMVCELCDTEIDKSCLLAISAATSARQPRER